MTAQDCKYDVFLSYARPDKEKARVIASALAESGLSLWWDVDLLPGQSFAEEIGTIIGDSKMTVVLWSTNSIQSSWVQSEANEALRNNRILFPVLIDSVLPPFRFRDLHSFDLVGWGPDFDKARLSELIDSVSKSFGQDRSKRSVDDTKRILDAPNKEAQYWNSICLNPIQRAGEYRDYLKKFGEKALFADLARQRIASLEREHEQDRIERRKIIKVSNIASFLGIVASVSTIIGFLVLVDIGSDRESKSANPCTQCPNVTAFPRANGSVINIASHEVTRQSWFACVGAGKCSAPQYKDYLGGRSLSASLPITGISPNDIAAYIDWLNTQSDDVYRLPYSSEWEVVAEAANSDLDSVLNYPCSTENKSFAWVEDCKVETPQPVGTLRPRPNGVYDIFGNVWVACPFEVVQPFR